MEYYKIKKNKERTVSEYYNKYFLDNDLHKETREKYKLKLTKLNKEKSKKKSIESQKLTKKKKNN